MDRLNVNKTNHSSLQKGKSTKILNGRHVHLIPDMQIWRPYRNCTPAMNDQIFGKLRICLIISLRSKAYHFSFKLLGLKRDWIGLKGSLVLPKGVKPSNNLLCRQKNFMGVHSSSHQEKTLRL